MAHITKTSSHITIVTGLSVALILLAAHGIFTAYTFSSVAGDVVKATTIERGAPVAESALPNGLEAVNAYRASKGLGPVSIDPQLNISAQAKAIDMVDRGYFEHFHYGETPWDFIAAAHYNYHRAGENLAKCFNDRTRVVDAWIASPAHEAVLTGDFENVGFGIRTAADGCDYVVAHFGSRN